MSDKVAREDFFESLSLSRSKINLGSYVDANFQFSSKQVKHLFKHYQITATLMWWCVKLKTNESYLHN